MTGAKNGTMTSAMTGAMTGAKNGAMTGVMTGTMTGAMTGAMSGKQTLVRQGTFTKEDPATFSNTPTCSDSDGSSVDTGRPAATVQIGRDAAHPVTRARAMSISSQSSRIPGVRVLH
jgi:hypothetical protein